MSSFLEDLAGSFLGRLNKEIDIRDDKADERIEKQETLARQNLADVKIRNQRATQGATLARQAKSLGANDAQIAAAFSNGMSGIQDFVEHLSAAASSMGAERLDPNDVDALIDISDIPDMEFPSYEDMANQVYGYNKTEPAQQAEIPGWAKILGLSSDQEAKQKLASTPFASGLSVQQINDMAAAPEFEKIAGMEATSMRYKNLPMMDVEKGAEWSMELNKSVLDIREEDGYKRVIQTGAGELETLINNNASTALLDAKRAEINKRSGKYIRDRISVTVSSTADVYKNSFWRNRSVLSIFDNLIELGAYTKEELAEMTSGLGFDEEPEAEETNESNSPGFPGNSEPVVDDTELPEELPETSTIKVGGEDVPAATPLNPTQQELVDNFMEGRIGPLEDNISTTVTKEQWRKMSRRERRNNNLPVSKLGASTYYFRDDINEILSDSDSKGLIAQVGMKNNPTQEFYKIKFPGELKSRTITKEQLAMIPDSALLNRTVKLTPLEQGEQPGRRVNQAFLEKTFGKITTEPEEE